MEIDRPPPGEELNPGPVTAARDAASAIVLRDGAAGVEVLLVKRNPRARFMGGAWVFPGGAVHDDDGGPPGAALRELEEEANVRLPSAGALVPFSRWITPEQVKIRFDTWFYLAAAPAGADPRPDGEECVDLRWMRPEEALAAGRRDEILLVFPTVKHLEELAGLASVEAALAHARAREIRPIMPRMVERDGAAHVLLPGEPGYPE